jgi:hypothetical protein
MPAPHLDCFVASLLAMTEGSVAERLEGRGRNLPQYATRTGLQRTFAERLKAAYV